VTFAGSAPRCNRLGSTGDGCFNHQRQGGDIFEWVATQRLCSGEPCVCFWCVPPISLVVIAENTYDLAPKEGILLPAGPAYLAYARRVLANRTLAQDIELQEKAEAERAQNAKMNGVSDGSGLEMDLGDEEEDLDLLARDPKEWKGQDHYAVLGLQKYRYKATDEQIKIAREPLFTDCLGA
jgi:hypothetical protein